jgi:hypothetical protein
MAVHANTIAYARITALADSCPRLVDRLGRDAFDRLVRPFIDLPSVRALPLIRVASGLADWLANDCAASPEVVELARLDAAALACLHATDTRLLSFADLPESPEALLAMAVRLHPAACLIECPHALAALGLAAKDSDSGWALVVRQGVIVDVLPLSPCAAAIARRAVDGATFANLFEATDPMTSDADRLAALLMLVGAAAFTPVPATS